MTLTEILGGISAAVKAATPPLLFALALLCSVILFAPDALVERLGIAPFVAANRPLIGLTLVAASCILLAKLAWWCGSHIKNFVLNSQRERNGRRAIASLTADEKAYLAPYIDESIATQYFRIDDGVALGLAHKGIIYRPTDVGYMVSGFAFNLRPWARTYLAKHPEFLLGASEPPERLEGGDRSW